MANALYTLARQAFLDGGINWVSDTINVALVSGSYTPNLDTDQYLSTVNADIIGTPVTLSSKTSTGGVADAANVTFSSVSSGSTVTYLLVYKSTGSASTSPLIALIDTATGIPVATNGGDINVAWDSSSAKIFTL